MQGHNARQLIIVVVVMLLFFQSFTVLAENSTTPEPKVEISKEIITSQALAGNLLGDPAERVINILLPPGYQTSEKRYPVVYVMTGSLGLPLPGGFSLVMQRLLSEGEVKDMIVVIPDGSNSFQSSQFRSSPVFGDFETYITRQVVDFVDTHYRTLPTRDSRGITGCGGGAGAAMRLGLKYPDVFSVVAATDGNYDDTPEMWPGDVNYVKYSLKELPTDIADLGQIWLDILSWYLYAAAAAAPDLDNPPFYCEMPIRFVDGQGEFVPEVIARIVEHDALHEARRFVEQPVRLRGIRIQHSLYETEDLFLQVQSFIQVLNELGIEHEYVEEECSYCANWIGWQASSLKYLAEKLVFEEE